MKQLNVLIIEDSIYWADLNIRELKRAGLIAQCKIVACKLAMKKALESGHWDIIISDNNMQEFDALQALDVRNRLCCSVPFIIVSEDMRDKDIEKAFKEGCCSYIGKEHLEILGQRVKEILEESENI